jgi:hypothetical protein
LKVYDGNLFRVSGGAVVSRTIPAQLATGDIWIDSKNQQMYFNDGTANVLAGPVYTQLQGLSGFQTGSITDTVLVDHTVLYLYLRKTLVGIFSLEEFTPRTPVTGFSGTIKVGFNVGNVPGLTFNVPATSATLLIAADGTAKSAENFVNTGDATGKSVTTNSLIISNSKPLVLGAAQNTEIQVDNAEFSLRSNTSGQNFVIKVNSTGQNNVLTDAIYVASSAQRVGIFNSTPTETLDVNGNVKVRGNLIVTGTSVIITSSVTPVSKTAAGIAGQIVWDEDYIYLCIAENTWKRVEISDAGW